MPTKSPTATPVDPTTTTPVVGIQTTKELYTAFDEYIEASDPASTVAASTFGFPMGTWDVSKITDFSRLFDTNRDSPLVTTRRTSDAAKAFNEDLSNWNVSSPTHDGFGAL